MKRIYTFIAIFVVTILVGLNYYFQRDIYDTQIAFQKNLIFKQAEICGSQIEKTGNRFVSDINEILYKENLANFFSDEEIHEKGLKNIQLFYAEYKDLIEHIRVYDDSNNVYSIFVDKDGEFINDQFTTQHQKALINKEMLIEQEADYFYHIPIMEESSLRGNVVIKIKFLEYFNTLFERYYIENALWQWLIDNQGNVVSQNFNLVDTIRIDFITKIVDHVISGRQGFMQHNVFHDEYTDGIISAFYPVRLLNTDFGIVFSLNTDGHLSDLLLKSVITPTLILFLLLISIIFIFILQKRTRDRIKDEDALPSIEDLINQLPIGVFVSTASRKIKAINKTAYKLLALDADDGLVGKDISHRFMVPVFGDNNDMFDTAEFIYYEKADSEIVLYKQEVEFNFLGEKMIMEAFIDVTEMERLRKQEAASNNAKSDFLANMSHEIRTPMNGIIGMTDALSRQDLSERQQEYVGIIQKSADLLLKVINDILDFSKIEAGKMKLEEVPFDLKEEIHLITNLFNPIADEKKIALRSNINPDVPINIIGDPFRLRQVISNLVSNAIKFTNQGEISISVSLKEDEGQKIKLSFDIEDTGIGIAEDKLEGIFQSFTQADGSTTRKYGGTGLGTTISKQLVELMNGEIGVYSPSGISTSKEQPGTRFTFSVEVFSNERITKNVDRKVVQKFEDVHVLLINRNGLPERLTTIVFDRLGMRVSILSDQDAMSKLKKAKEKKEKCQYHLVVIKDNVTFNGFQYMQDLHHADIHEDYILAIFSSNDKGGNYVKSRRLGADYYVLKPYNEQEIKQMIVDNYDVDSDLGKAPSEVTKKALNILVAEDNVINQKVAQNIFNNLGYQIQIASSGVEVVKLVEEIKFDVIFMDVQMPEKDGIETTMDLRASGYQMPIIAMTAGVNQDIQQRALSSGMNDYLIKPVNIDRIKQLLEELMEDD